MSENNSKSVIIFHNKSEKEITDFLKNTTFKTAAEILISSVKIHLQTYMLLNDFKNLSVLYLNCCNIKSLYETSFTSLVNLEKLKLEENLIEKIPEGLFKNNTRLTEISFRCNSIEYLPLLLFNNLTHLLKLDLGQNSFGKTYIFFIRNASLKTLILDRNDIQVIDDYSFCNMHNLKHLNLEKNQIHMLNNDCFFRLKKLHDLNLGYNKILELRQESFRNLQHLHKLTLSRNALKSLSDNLFQNNKHLKDVSIKHNQLQYVDLKVFKNNPIEHLTLDIDGNLNWKLFKHNVELKRLFLLVRNTETIKFDNDFTKYFENKHKLEVFKLVLILIEIDLRFKFNVMQFLVKLHIESIRQISDIKRSLITWASFEGMNHLEMITFINLNLLFVRSNNDFNTCIPNLKYIHFRSNINVTQFVSLPKLVFLKLVDCPMTSFTEDTFDQIPNLTCATFLKTSLDYISVNLFKHNSTLKDLNFTSSKIQEFPDYIFKELIHLRILNLSNNRIKCITKFNFYGLNRLMQLDLSYNPIMIFHEEAIMPLVSLEMLILVEISVDPKIIPGNDFLQTIN